MRAILLVILAALFLASCGDRQESKPGDGDDYVSYYFDTRTDLCFAIQKLSVLTSVPCNPKVIAIAFKVK